MSNLRGLKQKLSIVSRLWEEKDYDTALAEVESLLKIWPGNAHLYILWASLVQLQEGPKHDLDEAKQALQQAVELDRGSPAAAIELGSFLDNVEDNPQAASKAYSEGVATARRLLIEGLIGQAKVFRQLEKREEFLRCLLELLHLAQFETGPKRAKAEESGADILFKSPNGYFYAGQLKGPYAEQIQDLLNEVAVDRSA
jgi:lipopolysaccharide biosynthesis regulator YciM